MAASKPPFNPPLLDPPPHYMHGHGDEEPQQHPHIARAGRGNGPSPPHLFHTQNDEAHSGDEREHRGETARKIGMRGLIPGLEDIVRCPTGPAVDKVFHEDDRAEGRNPVANEASVGISTE